jgi:HlyD family secretion protein
MKVPHFGFGWLAAIAAIVAVAWFAWANQSSVFQNEAAELTAPPSAPFRQIAALGRLEPRGGVTRLAGPPRLAVVIKELMVSAGDYVKAGQIIAMVQGIDLQRAEVNRFRAELETAERELKRRESLGQAGRLAETELEAVKLHMEMAEASLERAKADLELSIVRSPIDGRILKVHAKEGERVGEKGIAELGDTARMYTIAEVYETDVGRVRIGQKARITSPALPGVLTGEVERIGLLIGKKDILKTDPVADADARVVEVDIRMDDPESAARLTNLRVDVVIESQNES